MEHKGVSNHRHTKHVNMYIFGICSLTYIYYETFIIILKHITANILVQSGLECLQDRCGNQTVEGNSTLQTLTTHLSTYMKT